MEVFDGLNSGENHFQIKNTKGLCKGIDGAQKKMTDYNHITDLVSLTLMQKQLGLQSYWLLALSGFQDMESDLNGS